MAIEIQRIVGYRDIFGKPRLFYKNVLARRVGRKRLLKFSALMLTYCRKGVKLPLEELLQMFFIYKGKFDHKGYEHVRRSFQQLTAREPDSSFEILSEEALLNFYTWAAKLDGVREDGNGLEGQNSSDLLQLQLLFNEDVLERFDKARRSSYKYQDRPLLRMIFSQRFPQNDIADIDYGKLVFTQAYKLMQLLNFLEAKVKYIKVYDHMLKDFNVESKEEFFKAIGGAALTPLNVNKPGINSIIVGDKKDSQANVAFLDKLAHSEVDSDQGPTDYRFLRDRPLQKLENEFRVIFDFFLIKKLYNGLTFKLSAYIKEDPTLFKGQLFGAIRDEFTEAVLLYETMEGVFAKTKNIIITGNDFKAVNLQREPDHYCRFNDMIILSESKDFFMTADEKLSYDFDTIMSGLAKDGRLKKATLQLATNVRRLLLKSLPLDLDYDPSNIIYPVIVLHDSLYNTPSLNYWANEWFQEELKKLTVDPALKGRDFSSVRPLTLVDIDTLILYRTNFENGELNLFEVLEAYQAYVDFKSCTDKNYERGIIPFAVFTDEYADNKGVKVDFKLLLDTYNFSDFKD